MLIINLDHCIGVSFNDVSAKGTPDEDTLINLHFTLEHGAVIEGMIDFFSSDDIYDSSYFAINNETGETEGIYPLDLKENPDKYTPIHYFVTINTDCPIFKQVFDKFYPKKTRSRN